MSDDTPALEWQQGETLGLHDAVSVVATWNISARDEVSFCHLQVWDPADLRNPILVWQGVLATNLVDAGLLLDVVGAALAGAMGYLTPVV